MKTEDGGYYGLKGYSFQYIYSMLKILDSEDENVDFDLEQVEDLGTKKELIQVKYKEKAKFQPSGIREPVLKLLKEMNSDERKLVLYCYFDDIENSKKINEQSIVLDSETKISVEYLDTILNKEKEGFSVLDKENFISKFSIIFTKTYDEKFFELINKIQTVYSCNEDTALVHYSCFMHHIMNKVVMNDTSNYEERKCSRKEFNILVESSKNTIINSHLEQIVGKEKYYSIIKKQLSFTKKPDNIEKMNTADRMLQSCGLLLHTVRNLTPTVRELLHFIICLYNLIGESNTLLYNDCTYYLFSMNSLYRRVVLWLTIVKFLNIILMA